MVSVAACISNPIGSRYTNVKGEKPGLGLNLNAYRDAEGFQGVYLSSKKVPEEGANFGTMALVTTHPAVDVQTRWYRGGWWDPCHMFWDDFSDNGRVRRLRDAVVSDSTSADVSSLVLRAEHPPRESVKLSLLLTWFFPDPGEPLERRTRGSREDDEELCRAAFQQCVGGSRLCREEQRATRRGDQSISQRTRRIQRASVCPGCCFEPDVDAEKYRVHAFGRWFILRVRRSGGRCGMLSAELHARMELRADTCLSLPADLNAPCVRPALPHNTLPSRLHDIAERLISSRRRTVEIQGLCRRPDGGDQSEHYREWQLSGDIELAQKGLARREARPRVCMEWPGRQPGPRVRVDEAAGPHRHGIHDKIGVMETEQHNTYDIEFYGPNTMTGPLYLAALKAGALMAEAMGEPARSKEYRELFERGSKRYDELLWNGDYFNQDVTVPRRPEDP